MRLCQPSRPLVLVSVFIHSVIFGWLRVVLPAAGELIGPVVRAVCAVREKGSFEWESQWSVRGNVRKENSTVTFSALRPLLFSNCQTTTFNIFSAIVKAPIGLIASRTSQSRISLTAFSRVSQEVTGVARTSLFMHAGLKPSSYSCYGQLCKIWIWIFSFSLKRIDTICFLNLLADIYTILWSIKVFLVTSFPLPSIYWTINRYFFPWEWH